MKKYTIIGSGMLAHMVAYYLYKSTPEGEQIRVTMHEKNASESATTARFINPSLTHDEIASVCPPAPELIAKLGKNFKEPGGIRIDDIKEVMGSKVSQEFVNAVVQYGQEEKGYEKRLDVLLKLGKISMELWDDMYKNADAELRDIMVKANFHPSREPEKAGSDGLMDGYRMDIFCQMPEAPENQTAMAEALAGCAEYQALGYTHTRVLTPKEVLEKAPHMQAYYDANSEVDGTGERVWKKTAAVLWRPGGCISTIIFIPLFHAYLTKKMGTYVNDEGVERNCFRRHLNHKVVELTYDSTPNTRRINGLRFLGHTEVKKDKKKYDDSTYIFCPGENVGTLRALGFMEPAYTRFAGAVLNLTIPMTEEQKKQFGSINQYCYLMQEGVVLTTHLRAFEDHFYLGVSGTKALYADIEPTINDEFCINRNLLQLNVVNSVYPDLIAMALNRPSTKGQTLGIAELEYLTTNKIAERFVGSRAVAFDGFPSVGKLADNGYCLTHAGSGGVSFSHALSYTLVHTMFGTVKPEHKEVVDATLKYGNRQRGF